MDDTLTSHSKKEDVSCFQEHLVVVKDASEVVPIIRDLVS